MPFGCVQYYRVKGNPKCAPVVTCALVLLVSGYAFAQQTGTGRAPATQHVKLAVAVAPDVAGLEESGPLLITLTNQSAASDAQILPGDVFRLVFDMGNGRIESIGRAAIVTEHSEGLRFSGGSGLRSRDSADLYRRAVQSGFDRRNW
jgi:hypothetical protein